ncbi:MAG: universal stress protein [Gammaproteobacteria bacterium]|jgi:universal stress protein E|nr:universal stress protein [Gammaproteobacteria bacterium]MBT3859694.1 universal stress protein [Gammaproteobacteria bacterium]MBT3987215.1 universal stress protein [Gammaproteobacteria bacterium]MBT4257188.1 universal stress protein [Gammaproteobacteria bacterium]MBT4581593.1 universal stress protein [Gammaproteobacteria bacterium]
MKTIEHLLVVVDPTVERDFVVDRAKMVAKVTNAKVTLFINNENTLTDRSYLYEGIDGEFFETQRQLFEDHYRKLLSDLAIEFSEENIDTTTLFSEHHHLGEAIIDKAQEIKPDVLLKSTHHHAMMERSVVSNTDWRLIRKCSCPVLLVKPNDWKANGSVVVAVDPFHRKSEQTDLDHRLLNYAELAANLLEQTPHVFHSFFPFVSTMFPLGSEASDGLESMKKEHWEKLKDVLESHNIEKENVHLSAGEIVPHLTKYLDSVDANILVVGALSRNFIERAIVGNTAEKILEDSPCDLLVIKPSAGEQE